VVAPKAEPGPNVLARFFLETVTYVVWSTVNWSYWNWRLFFSL